jgi:hypothetical protein
MPQPTGAFSTYDSVGNREDLIDKIWDVSPSDTPLVSSIAKTKSKAITHEWQTDALRAPAMNAVIEGNDASPTAPNSTTRLGNKTQLSTGHVVITGSEEAIDKAGRSSEVAYQMAREMEAMKTDIEHMVMGRSEADGQGYVTGDDSTPRKAAAIQAYLTSNTSAGTSGADATGDGSDSRTTGDDRNLTTTLVNTVLQSAYTNGGKPTMMVVSPTNKGIVDGFTGRSEARYTTSKINEVMTSVDVYHGSFHTLKVVPSRIIYSKDVLILDPTYLKLAELQKMHSYNLAKTGNSTRKEIAWEGTLEVCNEAAHALVADTNG